MVTIDTFNLGSPLGEKSGLAPSYDHAASLGQNETDEARRERLATRDRGRHISRQILARGRRRDRHSDHDAQRSLLAERGNSNPHR